MIFSLPSLSYELNALEPYMSRETLEYHYGKHLQTYIDNLNKMIEGTSYEKMPLEKIVITAEGGIFNNAAQAWNHTFFFNSLTPEQVEMPENLQEAIEMNFKSVKAFKDEFSKAAIGLFGSGWTWLVKDTDGRLSITQESNAENPLTKGLIPLLTVDVWEHAYYIDYRNRRAAFIEAWWNLVDWKTVAQRL